MCRGFLYWPYRQAFVLVWFAQMALADDKPLPAEPQFRQESNQDLEPHRPVGKTPVRIGVLDESAGQSFQQILDLCRLDQVMVEARIFG
jgi:hypothetical protein